MLRLVAVALVAAAPWVQRGDFTVGDLRVSPAPGDAGCTLSVNAVALGISRAACKVTALNETYPVGTIGKATFVAKTELAYGGKLSLDAEAVVKPHQHDGSMEIIVIQSGRGTFMLGDAGTSELGPGDAVVIPKGTVHGFMVGPKPVSAVQFYLPPGPEERFRPIK